MTWSEAVLNQRLESSGMIGPEGVAARQQENEIVGYVHGELRRLLSLPPRWE